MPGPSGSCAASREQCEQDDKAAAAEKLRAAQAELAALKRKIEGREQRIAREQVGLLPRFVCACMHPLYPHSRM